ncbi:MAG: UDP-N-acetylmuramoyl-L-alanine--D-glutamate ligase [Spirochaetales bacterium]|nr:UDP-N-acetylmuramoyl-L-alanine--D-glutamate ligase [Spirochaetales bacterium]
MTSNNDFESCKVTIMGLGLHGGGLASALFFVKQGADVTVTDLRSYDLLEPIIDQLKQYDIKFVLGEHRDEDFKDADFVIKNPAVPSNSRFLKLAKKIETDISIFLKYNRRPVIAVTGSKGKSTTVSALFDLFKTVLPETRLGGNITTSPLTFLEDCTKEITAPVILELSSWQLADIDKSGTLRPRISVITNIMPDHQNRYSSMDEYVADKKLIYKNQSSDDIFICNFDEEYGHIFAKEAPARIFFISVRELPQGLNGAFLRDNIGYSRVDETEKKILPKLLNIRGEHNRINLLFAALILDLSGIDSSIIGPGLSKFTGIAHRMEFVALKNVVSWFNDSASTIPQATAAALRGAQKPFRLIAGGTDKKLDFKGTIEPFALAEEIYLLQGSATERLMKHLDMENIPYKGPFRSLKELVNLVDKESRKGESVIFSPGATSFGMFLNEFDRGDKFRQIVLDLPQAREGTTVRL